jgi:hypothetical protein
VEIKVTRLRFSSYIKFVVLLAVSFGVGLGLLIFTLSLFGGNATANIGSNHLNGTSAGIAGLFISPITMLIMGSLFALVSYLPFLLVMRITKGIVLNVDFTAIDNPKIHSTISSESKVKVEEEQHTFDEYQLSQSEYEKDPNIHELETDAQDHIQEITDIQQFRTIKYEGRGYIVITDKANPTRVHKPNCSWVNEDNFTTKVLYNGRSQGQYYWVKDKTHAEQMGAVRCGKCM